MRGLITAILLVVFIGADAQILNRRRNVKSEWTNLVSWWKMDETSGGIAYDSHGSDDATVVSGTQTANGIVFDGVSDYLSCNGYTHGTNDFTFIVIITPVSTATSNTTILTGATNSLQWRLEDNITPFLSKYGGISSSRTDINLTLTTTSMLAVVRNGDNYRFFIDGNFETEVFSSSQDFTAPWQYIGAFNGGSFEFQGTMRDLCYFSDAKSDAFISAFYNSGSYTDYEDGEYSLPSPPTPTTDIADIHYFFENNSADSSGNGNDATTTNMVYGSSSAAQGDYYGDFTADSRQFQLPTSYTITSPFSISLWFRVTATGGYYRFMDVHQDAVSWEKWLWWLDGVAFDIEFRGYQESTNAVSIARTDNATWSAGSTWRHVVLVYDNGTATFYYDGVDETYDATTWGTADMDLNAAVIHIGRYFNGDIDDFSIYDFGLSSSQVTTLYNSGTPGTILTE